jgi:hypothetical protein
LIRISGFELGVYGIAAMVLDTFFASVKLCFMSGLFLTIAELEAGLEHIRQAPKDHGVLELIVCRPESGGRKILDQGTLDSTHGLIGDNWHARGSAKMPDGSANPETQITIMNSRCVALLAQERTRWPLAGDQLFIDLDLSLENLPPGTQLAVGSAIIEITPPPHTGCKKFVSRFGLEAMQFVNSPVGRALNLRGVNARILQSGSVKVGDQAVKKLTGAGPVEKLPTSSRKRRKRACELVVNNL